MTAVLAALIGRLHRHPAARDDHGFGYSRDQDIDANPAPVPAGVELIFLTGRTPRGAR